MDDLGGMVDAEEVVWKREERRVMSDERSRTDGWMGVVIGDSFAARHGKSGGPARGGDRAQPTDNDCYFTLLSPFSFSHVSLSLLMIIHPTRS